MTEQAPTPLRPFAAGPVRKLSTEERFRWAECPVCHAKHGEVCFSITHANEQIREFAVDEQGRGVSAHFLRIERAPFKVREVPVQT